MKTLTPTYSPIDKAHQDKLTIMRKERWFFKYLERSIPDEIKEIVTYSITDMGRTCIRCFFTFKEDISTDQIQVFFKYAKSAMKHRFVFSKFFREDDGTFAYRMDRSYRNGADYIIFFENAPNVDGCEIKKKIVEKEVYYSDCGELKKQFN